MLAVVSARTAQYDLALDGQRVQVRMLALDMLDALARIVDGQQNDDVVQATVCATAMMLMASSPIDNPTIGLDLAAGRLADMAQLVPGELP
jgi:hypothetical protein